MDQSILGTAFKMTVALGVVLLLFGVSVLIARKFAGSSRSFLRKSSADKLKPLEILSHKSLGPGRGVYMLRCGEKKILIGATNQSITHLMDIDEDETENEEEFSDHLSERYREVGRV